MPPERLESKSVSLDFFTRPVLRGQHQIRRVLVAADLDDLRDAFLGLERQQVRDVLTASRARCLRQVVRLGAIHPALGGEEQDPVVGGADEEMVDDVVGLEPGTLHALAAAFLAAVQIGLRALGVTGFGDRDDDVLAGDQVLVGNLAVGRDDPGAPVVAVLVGDLLELVAHDTALTLRLGENVLQVGDLGLDLGQIVDDALTLQCRQPAQLHVEDGLRLDLVDVEQFDQALTRIVDGLRGADQRDHLVERVERLDQAAQNVGALVGFSQPVAGAPDDDVELVVDVDAGSAGPVVSVRGTPSTIEPACWRRSWSAVGCACTGCSAPPLATASRLSSMTMRMPTRSLPWSSMLAIPASFPSRTCSAIEVMKLSWFTW